MNFIKPLLACDDKELTSKAFYLRLLARSGFFVPLAYYIGNDCLESNVAGIKDFDTKARSLALHSNETRLLKLQEDIWRLPLSCQWESEISRILAKHRRVKRWILRSSFGCEDHVQSSFAGCFLSVVLQNPTVIDVWHGILKVQGSLFDPASWTQVLAAGISPSRCSHGIIFQQYVEGQLSGVGFSRDPKQLRHFIDRPKELNGYTEWIEGSCDQVTQGSNTCQRALLSDKHGGPLRACWNQLQAQTKKAERLLGAPIDFEWSWDQKRLWWLQARPVATDEIALIKKSKNGQLWTRDQIDERFPEVMTPMGWSLVQDVLTNSLRELETFIGIRCVNIDDASLFFRGHAFANADYFRYANCKLATRRWSKVFTKGITESARSTVIYIRQLIRQNLEFKASGVALLHIVHQSLLHEASQEVLREWHYGLDEHIRKIKAFDTRRGGLDALHELRALSFAYFRTDLAIHLLKEICVGLLRPVLLSLGLKDDEILSLYDCFAKNATLGMRQSVHLLKIALGKDPGALPFLDSLKTDFSAHFQESLPLLALETRSLWSDFLEDCGHVTDGWDTTNTCLKENGKAIAGLLGAVREDPRAHFKDGNSIDLAKRLRKLPKEWAESILQAIQTTRELCEADELQHFYAGLYLEKSRQLLKNLGDELVEKDILADAHDIHYLSVGELEQILEQPEWTLQFLVRRRSKMWQRYREKAIKSSGHQCTVLHGVGASPGKAMGTIHFVNGWDDLRKIPRDAILCMKTPNPSYVPWFDLCNAVITETGGLLSHGFIAAREMQIPCVSGVDLNRLTTGARVLVDGSTGQLTVQQ